MPVGMCLLVFYFVLAAKIMCLWKGKDFYLTYSTLRGESLFTQLPEVVARQEADNQPIEAWKLLT